VDRTAPTRIKQVTLDPTTGWGRVIDEEGKRYDTKKRDKLEQAAELKNSGGLVVIEFNVRDSQNTNPHTGQPYKNYYYENALPSNGSQPTIPGVDVEQPRQRATEDPRVAWRICLSAGAKLALATLPMLPTDERSFEYQKQMARAWAEYFFFSSPPETPALVDGSGVAASLARAREAQAAFQAPAGAGGPGAYSEPSFDSPPPPTDDDIPF